MNFILLGILTIVFALLPIITTLKIKRLRNQLIALFLFGLIIIILSIPFQLHRSISNLDLGILAMGMAIGLVLSLIGLEGALKSEEEPEEVNIAIKVNEDGSTEVDFINQKELDKSEVIKIN